MSHAKIAALVDGIRNEFSSTHPASPDKGWLRQEAHKLIELVEGLPGPAPPPTSAAQQAALAGQSGLANLGQQAALNTSPVPPATTTAPSVTQPAPESLGEKVLHGIEHALGFDNTAPVVNSGEGGATATVTPAPTETKAT